MSRQESDSDSSPRSPVRESPVPVVVHLSGSRRGTTQRLRGSRLRIGTASDSEVHVAHEPSVAVHHATLIESGSGYELVPEKEFPVWVNGRRVESTLLSSGDVIEIGTDGPILRYRQYPPGSRAYKSPQEAFSDCIDCARYASDSSVGQAAVMIANAPRELATQTSLRFRFAMLAAIVVLALLIAFQWRSVLLLEHRLESREIEIEGLAALLDNPDQTVNREELARISIEVTSAVERVEALEARSAAPARIVSQASQSIAFIQGSFGFVDPRTGGELRFVSTSSDSGPLRDSEGNPAVTVGGTGPVVEVMFTGTGFVATEDGLILTNRHVAVPWEYDTSAQQVVAAGLTAKMRRFCAFLPERPDPIDVHLLVLSPTADLALLRPDNVLEDLTPLPLSSLEQKIGDEVLVLGYPTGINALLARADRSIVERFASSGADLQVWDVTRELARAGQISPLVSRGIVAQITQAAVVFDAETTQGGSGGPVLDLEGRVVAVTSAIVPEFGGSNLGVPVAQARQLIVRAESGDQQPPGLP